MKWVRERVCMRASAVTCQALKPKSKANAPSLSSYSYIHEKINTRASDRGERWWRGGGWVGAGTSRRGSWLSLFPQLPFRLTWCPPAARLDTLNRGFSLSCVKWVKLSHVCAVRVSHLSGHWWTRLCSFASAAGSTCAERRCTAMLGRLEHAGQRGTYMCKKTTYTHTHRFENLHSMKRKKENQHLLWGSAGLQVDISGRRREQNILRSNTSATILQNKGNAWSKKSHNVS